MPVLAASTFGDIYFYDIMGYSVYLTSIRECPIDKVEIERYCDISPNLKFDTTKSWTNIFNEVVLYKTDNGWDFVCGFDKWQTCAECADPNSEAFFEVVKIADAFDLFVVGEEDEICYIPNYGKPSNRLDFEKAKKIFKESRYNLKQIIGGSGYEG